MRRRQFLGVIGAAAVWPTGAGAQQPKVVPRIGILWHEASAAEEDELGFRPELFEAFAKLGYVAGRTATFVERFPGDLGDRYQRFAQELADLNVDVIVAVSAPSAIASQRATSVIPIVFSVVPDPVGARLANSLARPGGNITGLSSLSLDQAGKRVEILHELVPSVSRIALLYDRLVSYHVDREVEETEAATKSLGLAFKPVMTKGPDDFNDAFAEMVRSDCDALVIGASPMLFNERSRISQLAISSKLPTITGPAELAASGILCSYGVKLISVFSQTPSLVDKVLKGEKPADIPVQQPTTFQLVINLRTARALGLEISPVMLARADRVVE
jgi:putative ABC transport system substrate-binding protein